MCDPSRGPSDHSEQIDLLGRFGVALDLVKGKGAGMRVQPIGARCGFARFERAEALADFAALDVRLHGEQGLRRVIAQRARKRDLVFGGNTRRIETGCAELFQQLACEALDDRLPVRLRGLVTTASVDQPRLSMPRKPERSATRCFWPSLAKSWFQNTNAPETAHSPGAAARSKTKVSTGRA